MNIINNIKKISGAALLTGAAAFSLNSCTEKIDDSDLYTFTGEMMIDHFVNEPETFSSYLQLLERVHPSKKSPSTMKDLLSARGNYTCFAPTNKAINDYLDTLLAHKEITSKVLADLPDSIAKAVVFNSIIENGNDQAYATTDFEEGALSRTNMNDRYISISYDNDSANNTITKINVNSNIVDGDIKVENGYIHAIDRVLSPSNATVADLIQATENTQFFGELLGLTGLDSKLVEYIDPKWEDRFDEIQGDKTPTGGIFDGKYPDKRKIGFTVFVETDSVFKAKGINNITDLREYVRLHNHFDDDTNRGHATSWENDYHDDYNWLNQFVSYHLLPERLTYNTMVIFANECGNTAQDMSGGKTPGFKANVWEYWETIGVQRRTLKVTGCRIAGILQRRINRQSIYNQGNYKEQPSAITADMQGILINPNNGIYNNDALNGIYFTIDDILLWEDRVPNKVLNERMRYDITSLFPELMTNNIRQNRTTPSGWYFTLDYLDNLVDMDEANTRFCYLPNCSYSSGTGSWMDYQIDEFNIHGQYDFTMKLPPVPYTGTYELRYGVWANSNRGMAQIYLGKNPKNLPAIGVPLDLRNSGVMQSATGWVSEAELGATVQDSTALYENQKTMRNLGFMKGPKYVTVSGGTARDSNLNLRKIIFTGQFEAGETYYIRFKNVLTDPRSEFFYDYIELVPKSVYAGDNNEDIW